MGADRSGVGLFAGRLTQTIMTRSTDATGDRCRTPDQILGPYFPVGRRILSTCDLAKAEDGDGHAQGEIIEIRGRILNLDAEPIRGARLTIWQANSFGRYLHGNDTSPAPLDPNFVGSTRIRSRDDGSFVIRTIKPGAYAASPGWRRPPHIHFEVCGRFERLVTQMYFPGEPLNDRDRLLAAALRPELLVAEQASLEGSQRVLNFDIVLTRG
jgi:protocatechuate 3,4-dioxygenase, beta subunit